MNDTGGMTVSQLNLVVAEAIRREPRTRSVTVHGEVSGFRPHLASGHWYFSLKDEESSVSCVMFRQNTFHARIKPRDGDSVILSGYVDVYPKNGTYQLYVMSLRPDGLGDQYLKLEELKKRLSAEGLFDPARKRVLPLVPRKVAVVTSGSGAAWHDILNVSAMRNPSVPVVLIPTAVQGEKAGEEIAEAIRQANEQTDADVMIIARGGGSAEDLWCFNDEAVARAVAGSRIPVVSGVGHEIDTTVCDLAADVRASTPSNAAEIVFPDKKELSGKTEQIRHILRRAAETKLSDARERVRSTALRLSALSPERHVSGLSSGSRLYREQLMHAIRIRLDKAAGQIKLAEMGLSSVFSARVENVTAQMFRIRGNLEAVNPQRVLERGYALVTDRKGNVLTGTEQARISGDLRIRFADGTVDAAVKTEER